MTLSDLEREQCINLCKQIALGSSGVVQRWFYEQMVTLQKQRSVEQVEQIERERGLR